MLRHSLTSLIILIALLGCGRERIADIATEEQITDKDLLLIFPSTPEEYCYSDSMTELFNDISQEQNITNRQMFSTPQKKDCTTYGFEVCQYATVDGERQPYAVECISEDESQICLYFLGIEFKDVNGDTFDETCMMGADRVIEP